MKLPTSTELKLWQVNVGIKGGELAKLLNVHQAVLSRFLHGQRALPVRTNKDLVKVVTLSPRQVVNRLKKLA